MCHNLESQNMKAARMRKARVASAAICVGVGMAVPAVSRGEVQTMISGYGTLGVTSINKSDLEFRSSWNQSKGAGTKPDFGVDSRFGVQGVVKFNPQFSATAQVLAQRRRVDAAVNSNDDLNTDFEWIFGQYSPITNLDIRAGRVVLPAFMVSDSRNVGYSQPWVRAPLEVYASMPVSKLDGGQVLWRIPVGSAIVTVQPSYGRSSVNIQTSSWSPQGALRSSVIEGRATDVKSINLSLEWGDWLVRVGQMRSRVDVPLLALAGITQPLRIRDKFTGVGLQYDNGKALFMAEWAQRRMKDSPVAPFTGASAVEVAPGIFLPNNQVWALSGQAGTPLAKTYGWYAGGGWRFGPLLPMVLYGRASDEKGHTSTHSVHGSLRYDWKDGVALKAQVGRHFARDNTAFVTPERPTSDRKVTVLSFAVDFVF